MLNKLSLNNVKTKSNILMPLMHSTNLNATITCSKKELQGMEIYRSDMIFMELKIM